MNDQKTHSERLARVLDILKEKSGCRVASVKNIIASIGRKERSGKLPANKGFAFAAHHAKTALRFSEMASAPWGNDFMMNQFIAETERAESWINRAITA